MKQLRIVIAMTIIALLLGLTGVVYAENGPESVNTFSVSPDPQTAGSDVTLSINVDIADGLLSLGFRHLDGNFVEPLYLVGFIAFLPQDVVVTKSMS